MTDDLSSTELKRLIRTVFPRLPSDTRLAILVDIPDDRTPDTKAWQERRRLAHNWATNLRRVSPELGLEIDLIGYCNVGSSNADLPSTAFKLRGLIPSSANELPKNGNGLPFRKVFTETQIFIALTQHSATAPLKVAAKEFGFRAATLPGFSLQMIPTLRLNFDEVSRRCLLFKEKLDNAVSATVQFIVDGQKACKMFFDLRFRQATASAGRFPIAGNAGNLPGGETYIVPYEGESNEPSNTSGTLPVQFTDGLVYYTVAANKAVGVDGEKPAVVREARRLVKEPAYGNLAEFAFGILADFGLKPIGEILMDEKLGFHIAFGRSDHFGGAVGPKDFTSPEEVCHIDRVYVRETMPRIRVRRIVLELKDGQATPIMADGKYLIL